MQDKAILNLCVIFGRSVLHSLYIFFLFETVNQAYFNSTKTRKVCGFNELSITTVSPFHLFLLMYCVQHSPNPVCIYSKYSSNTRASTTLLVFKLYMVFGQGKSR